MSDLKNTVKGWVGEMLAQQGQARHGIVANVDPARALVRITLDEDGTLSGWLPIAQQAVGNGWGVVTLPPPGTQVFAIPDMGDQSHMVIVGAVHSTQQPPGQVVPYRGPSPIPLVPGEPTIMGPSGQSIRLTRAGTIELHGPVRIDGDVSTNGNVSVGSGATGSFTTPTGQTVYVRNGIVVRIV